MNFRHTKGFMSAFLLLGMTVLLVFCVGVSGLAVQSMKRSMRDGDAVMAFQAAQAGLEYQIAKSYSEMDENQGNFESLESSISAAVDEIAPGATVTVQVQPTSDARKAWITSTCTYNGFKKSLRMFVDSRNVGIWNNAIFAGTGALGQSINGNVDIRGSVHILGEGEPYSDVNHNGHWDAAEAFTDSNHNNVWDPGEPFVDANGDQIWNAAEPYQDYNKNGSYDPPLTETDLNSTMSGSAYIGNNYYGIDAGLQAKVPPPPSLNGVEQLGTEVRAKHGRISINGSANIGEASDLNGGLAKGKIDGSYVSDGYTGNQGASQVFSDNGTSNTYDLGFLGIEFPFVNGLGAKTYKDSYGTVWETQEAFLEARSMTVSKTMITATTAAFSYGPDAYGNSISFTPKSSSAPAKLTVNGIVRFANGLQLGGSKELINFDGNGTIYGRSDISISCSLLPVSGKLFPTQARIGLLAMGNLNLACGSGDAQLSLAGAFYAQGKVVSKKQNQVLGTFVSNYFDMGTNVPKIYQVPTLAYNLPPGMPGDNKYYTVKTKAWRERITTSSSSLEESDN